MVKHSYGILDGVLNHACHCKEGMIFHKTAIHSTLKDESPPEGHWVAILQNAFEIASPSRKTLDGSQ